MATPITEEGNPITTDIDVASPKEIVNLLEKCDSEIFNGWGDYSTSQRLFSPSVLEAIDLVQGQIEEMILPEEEEKDGEFNNNNNNNNVIVIAGCGTSGRLAFQTVRTMKRLVVEEKEKEKEKEEETFKRRPKIKKAAAAACCFEYLIAGGDRALFTSQESFEDDPHVGAELLEKVASGKKRILYIGITCGLSAPFVAGQIDHCLNNPDRFIPVLIGFNPAHLARSTRIEKWGDRSFLDLMESSSYQRMVLEGRAFLINPVLGPEPICGSSRMKGGSATKIILGTLFAGACCRRVDSKPFQIEKWIRIYEGVFHEVYKQAEHISQVVELAGQALKSEGRVYYLGEENLGITGLIDCSECPPTFGADMNDFRAFLFGGYTSLQNAEGDLTVYGEEYFISMDHFKDKISKDLQETDLVICLTMNSNVDFVKSFLPYFKCKTIFANFLWKGEEIVLPANDRYTMLNFCIPFQTIESMVGSDMATLWSESFCEISAKIFLNSVSTGAHVLKGKVFKNLMIDVKPTNNKLFHRSLKIIRRFSGLSEAKSLEFLLKSIYNTDSLTPDILARPVASHVEHSSGKAKIVPVALLASLKNCSIQKAKEILAEEPVIRNVIYASLNPEF